jgi:hypothetical protein
MTRRRAGREAAPPARHPAPPAGYRKCSFSGLDSPSRASRAIWASWPVSSSCRAGKARLRAVTPVACSSRRARSANAAMPVRARGLGPWPSVENWRRHRPSWRHGRRPLCVRGHRNTGVYSDPR